MSISKYLFENFLSLKSANEETFDPAPNKIWHSYRTDNALVTVDDDGVSIDIKGTERTAREWMYNFWFARREWGVMGCIHRGFGYNVHELLGDRNRSGSILHTCLNSKSSITLRGHSRGGPNALLMATLLVAAGVNRDRIQVLVYGCPKLGDKKFARSYAEMLGGRTITVNGSTDWMSWVPWWSFWHGTLKSFYTGRFIPRHSLSDYEKYMSVVK